MQNDLVAALDIGGTKIAGALVDSDGRILVRAQRPTPAQEDGETVMRAVSEVVGELTASPLWARAGALGIGSAGPVDASAGTVSPVNVPGWRDFPLVERVRAAAGGLPVELVGDGVAIAAAEHWQGAARGHDNALCMVVSTGVGGGLVLGGSLYSGPTGNAGHIGHISVQLDGDPCPCGARGCVERIASGPNIARRALESGWRPGPDGDTSAAAVAEAARAGDPVALASFERAAQALAAGIAATATLVEIDIAVIGGGVAKSGDVLFAPLRRALRDYATLSFVQQLTVVPALMGTDAGLVGAAAAALGSRAGAAAAGVGG
ncbi:ROK family protein [Streptomyces jeddahensis]|uniref:N-acetylmannosamine kinase n=1 Tax=Streptomyces jeddahensis TaxID=1716141 RepID=A0A177HHG0_9ACTN|nr:ROK family protein [Streptomyces jeddahensis]OAH09724.1 N-acetylmannosamine kinase [Streptomyces jeddahensis]